MDRSTTAVILGLAIAGCSTVRSRHAFIDQAYPPRPDGAAVTVLAPGAPSGDCVRVSRLDVHIEKTMLVGSTLDEALPALQREARASGADTIAQIEERTSRLRETRMYHVTAIGLRCGKTEGR
jgi:hypothetical protein